MSLGTFVILERDPNSALPPPVIGGFSPTVIGQEAPDYIGLDDLCPPRPSCPDCATMHALRYFTKKSQIALKYRIKQETKSEIYSNLYIIAFLKYNIF